MVLQIVAAAAVDDVIISVGWKSMKEQCETYVKT